LSTRKKKKKMRKVTKTKYTFEKFTYLSEKPKREIKCEEQLPERKKIKVSWLEIVQGKRKIKSRMVYYDEIAKRAGGVKAGTA
jgi:hypothetical protein